MMRTAAVVAIVLFGCKSSEREPEPAPPPTPVEAEKPAPPAPAGPAYQDLVIDTAPVDGGFDATVKVTRAPGGQPRAGRVRYTAEPINLAGRVPREELREDDVLGSGTAIDLDGDGKTTSSWPASCDGGVGVIGELRFAPVMELGPVATWRYGDRPAQRIGGARGAHAMLYTRCSESDPVTVGIAPAGGTIEVLEVDGPALQVMVFERAAALDAAPSFELAIARDGGDAKAPLHLAHVFEPVLTADPAWHVTRWAMVPLDPAAAEQRVTLKVRGGDAERMVVASIHQGGGGFDRSRTRVAGVKVPASN